MTYDVLADEYGVTVAKPGDYAPTEYRCVATFGLAGIRLKTTDDWRPLPDRDGKPSLADWGLFKLEVSRLFGVNLPEDYQPKWLTEE